MSTLTVGAGQAFQTIAAAVVASHDGDLIQVQAGTYLNDFAEITKKITIQGVGGLAHIVATTSPPNGKAILTTDTDVHLDHIELSGAAVGDGNGAGIRYQGGNLIVTNAYIHDNQDGILGNTDPTGSITIDGSEIAANGAGDGRTHNLYIGQIASFTLTNSYVHDAVVGHEVKSRAAVNVITGNRIQNNAGSGSYLIDLPNGGAATISNNLLQKGVNAENPVFITTGEEGSINPNPALTVTNNIVVNDLTAHTPYVIVNRTAGPATLANNALWGVADTADIGAVATSGNTALSARPALDTTTTAPAGAPTAIDFDTNGAVIPNGNVLTVGQGRQFATIAAAIAAAHDGDTIRIAPGTYTDDGGYIAKNLVLEGDGGTVKIVSDNGNPTDHQAIFVTDANVTLKNFDLSGATIADSLGGNGAGVRMHSGNLTIIDSRIHDNQDGVLATPDRNTGTVTIVNSEIDHNGNATGQYAGQTANVSAGPIQTLTIVGAYIHDPVGGSGVRSRSKQTIVTASRIGDGASGTGASAIDLPNAGTAVIANSLLEKGPNGAPAAIVAYGEDGPTNGGKLQVFDTAFSNEGAATAAVANPHAAPVSLAASSAWNLAAPGLANLSAAPDLTSAASLDTTASGVYRFYSTATGTHFLTGSTSEALTLLMSRPDMTFEGLGLSAAPPPAQDPDAAPVFRFFDTATGTHFFTTSAAERDQVAATRSDLVLESASFYEHLAPQPGDVAVYRFFDTLYGTHFYTDDATERATLDATRADLKDEGIAFYSPKPV